MPGCACRASAGSEQGDARRLPFDLARAHDLYTALFGPVETSSRTSSCSLCPPGPLTSLPFGVLVTEAARDHRPGQAGRLSSRCLARHPPADQRASIAWQVWPRCAGIAKSSAAPDPFAWLR